MFAVGLSAIFTLHLPIAFFLVAAMYASAGFGGGSTYSALLSQVGLAAHQIPLISLPCNIVVSGAGFVRFARHGLVPLRQLALVALVSMPAAFVGGRLPVPPRLFFLTLGTVLLFAGLVGLYRLIRSRATGDAEGNAGVPAHGRAKIPVRARSLMAIGGVIGFVSGVAGIGGGILLSPVLLRRTESDPRQVAALSAGFIFLNSIAGLTGQIARSGLPAPGDLAVLATLTLSVLAGGAVGTTLALRASSRDIIRGGTHVLLSLVGGRLLL